MYKVFWIGAIEKPQAEIDNFYSLLFDTGLKKILLSEFAAIVKANTLDRIHIRTKYRDWMQINTWAFKCFIEECYNVEAFAGTERINTLKTLSELFIQFNPIIDILTGVTMKPETIVQALQQLNTIYQQYETTSMKTTMLLIEIILPVVRANASLLKGRRTKILCGTFIVKDGTYYIN